VDLVTDYTDCYAYVTDGYHQMDITRSVTLIVAVQWTFRKSYVTRVSSAQMSWKKVRRGESGRRDDVEIQMRYQRVRSTCRIPRILSM